MFYNINVPKYYKIYLQLIKKPPTLAAKNLNYTQKNNNAF